MNLRSELSGRQITLPQVSARFLQAEEYPRPRNRASYPSVIALPRRTQLILSKAMRYAPMVMASSLDLLDGGF